LTIRDQRLYRTDFASFDDYLRTRWKMSRSRGYQFMTSARIASELAVPLGEIGQTGENGQDVSTTVGILPERESQLRPLAKVEPGERRPIWNAAVAEAGGQQPTASQVERISIKAYETREPQTPLTVMVKSPPPDPVGDRLKVLDYIEDLRYKHGYGHVPELDSFFKEFGQLVDTWRKRLTAKRKRRLRKAKAQAEPS
jgi:hypothetical protein